MDKSSYYARRTMHRCVQCNKKDAFTLNGRAYCADCNESRAEYYRRWRELPEKKEKISQAQKERRERCKAEGICVMCGKRPAVAERCLCQRCAVRERLRQKAKRKGPPPEWVCHRCRKAPALEGRKLCEKCYADAVRAARIAAEAKLKRRAEREKVRNG